MKKFREIIESSYDEVICSCHNITRGSILDEAKFNSSYSAKEIFLGLLEKSIQKNSTGACGCCTKDKKSFDKHSCKKKRKLDIHYSEALR